MMAAKVAIIKDEVAIALKDDPDFRSGLAGQFKSFKANLLPALEPDEFADIYAEMITYGMGEGDDIVAAGYPRLVDHRIHNNPDQYFDTTPQVAWGFHLGGYQPAQKWLKDRRGRTLSWDDIGHYQRILSILSETERIMAAIALPLDPPN